MISGQEIHWKFSGFLMKSKPFLFLINFKGWILYLFRILLHYIKFQHTQFQFSCLLSCHCTETWKIGERGEKSQIFWEMLRILSKMRARPENPSKVWSQHPVTRSSQANYSFSTRNHSIGNCLSVENHWFFSDFLSWIKYWYYCHFLNFHDTPNNILSFWTVI